MSRWTGLKIYTKLIYQQLETLQVGKFQVEFWWINLGQENDDDADNTGCRVFKRGVPDQKDVYIGINIPKGYHWILSLGLKASWQK